MDQEDVRTPGWDQGAVNSCVGWEAWRHIAVAEALLDANAIQHLNEDAWNGKPPYRHYDSVDRTHLEDPAEIAPFLAAITHALLAIAKKDDVNAVFRAMDEEALPDTEEKRSE